MNIQPKYMASSVKQSFIPLLINFIPADCGPDTPQTGPQSMGQPIPVKNTSVYRHNLAKDCKVHMSKHLNMQPLLRSIQTLFFLKEIHTLSSLINQILHITNCHEEEKKFMHKSLIIFI